MRDVIPLAVLALLLTGAATVVVGATCAVIAGGRWLRRLLFPRPLPAPFVPRPRLYVWLACDTPRCGHLQTPHYPAGPGLVRCNACDVTRPQP